MQNLDITSQTDILLDEILMTPSNQLIENRFDALNRVEAPCGGNCGAGCGGGCGIKCGGGIR